MIIPKIKLLTTLGNKLNYKRKIKNLEQLNFSHKNNNATVIYKSTKIYKGSSDCHDNVVADSLGDLQACAYCSVT